MASNSEAISSSGGTPLFLQAVDVGLGEDAALAGHRVQLDALVAHLAKLLGGDVQLGVDLVDDGAGAAGALVVHRGNFLLAAGVGIFLEDDDLGVLAAELDDRAALGVELFHRQGHGVHFLNELSPDQWRNAARTAAGDEHPRVAGDNADLLFHAGEELHYLLRLLGVVALVVRPEDLVVGRIDDHRFYRGRAYVQTHHQRRAFRHAHRRGFQHRRRWSNHRCGERAERDESPTHSFCG